MIEQVCPLGVRLSVLLRFAESVTPGLSTAEAVWKYIIPQTRKPGCRYIDLVMDNMKEDPGFYVAHR